MRTHGNKVRAALLGFLKYYEDGVGIKELRWLMNTYGVTPGLVIDEDLCTQNVPVVSPAESL